MRIPKSIDSIIAFHRQENDMVTRKGWSWWNYCSQYAFILGVIILVFLAGPNFTIFNITFLVYGTIFIMAVGVSIAFDILAKTQAADEEDGLIEYINRDDDAASERLLNERYSPLELRDKLLSSSKDKSSWH